MTYLYLLAGENLKLAEAEVKGFLKSQKIETNIKRHQRLLETEKEPKQLKRLALTHEVAKKIKTTSRENPELDYTVEERFAVRAENLTDKNIDTQEIERELGDQLKNEKNEVDLNHPKTLIKAYITEKNIIIGKIVENIPRNLFKERKNQKRPFSSPISLDPKLARVLINLSETPPGKQILDPFCGTGGILIEAGLCGIGVNGLDIQEEMVKGTRENLEEYGIIAHNIKQGNIKDVEELFDQDFHSIITDLPYGKASKTEGEPTKTFLNISKNLCKGKIVFMSNKEEINGLKPQHKIYVHKNLTRYIYIL